ncbi:hypothetical protein TNCV_1379491 [Trichonephila clavipes]|nr:hypothetical protein TNCV_1379491 [Trichonephila clavipes]
MAGLLWHQDSKLRFDDDDHKFAVMTTRKVGQSHHRTSVYPQDRYLALSTLRHKWTTAPQPSHDLADVSGRRICRQAVYDHLAEIGLYTRRPVLTASSWKDQIL